VKERPAKAQRRFEVLILRPLSIAFPVAAVVCLMKTAWVLAAAMLACWLIVGVIGQSLPHRKQDTFSELAGGSPLPAHDEVLSHGEAYALAKAIMGTAVVVAFVALLIAWKMGLRWYWVLLATFGTYVGAALFAGLLLLLWYLLRKR
jgi:hypothetical protein